MPYCTLLQLQDRYSERLLIQLSDREDVAATEIDTAMIDRAIADADAVIDGYLKPVYALPISTVPKLLTSISIRLSIYNAHSNVASEKITNDMKSAMAELRDISTGKIKLDLDGVEPEGSGAAEVITNEPEQTFNAGTMKGFI